MTTWHADGMGLRDRLYAAAVAELERVAAELAAQAPHRDVHRPIVVPTPEELPGVLDRARAQLRIGQPDIHQGERMAPSFLFKSS